MSRDSRHPVREVGTVFLAVTTLTILVSAAGRLQFFAPYVHLLVGALFFWAAVHMSQREPDGLRRYGLMLGGLLEPPAEPPTSVIASVLDLGRVLLHGLRPAMREIWVALIVSALIFPPFAYGFYLFHAPTRAFHLSLPEALPSFLLTQVLVVAIPEEALFRGYFQGRLNDLFTRRLRLLGVPLALPSLLLQALLFALMHFAVDLNPARLAVFFPALLFGWLRELRSGIGAPAVFHALCNLFSEVLTRSWL
jgi:membrane protease YdiL (CAAX protease family)